jgi:hypothetical protein
MDAIQRYVLQGCVLACLAGLFFLTIRYALFLTPELLPSLCGVCHLDQAFIEDLSV